jgi:hypothetical protein
MVYRRVFCVVLLAGALTGARGESAEWGLVGGGSFFPDKAVTAPFGKANAGFARGFAAGLWGGHNYRWVGGEIRYLFEHQPLRVATGAARADFRGRSHAIHYNLLIHAAPAEAKLRPFVAVGGGIKGYQGTGTERLYQPLQEFALLTRTSQWKGLVVFGGGLKWALSPRVVLRLEVYDYLTEFPEKVIAPAPGASLGGWIHNLVPAVGAGFLF